MKKILVAVLAVAVLAAAGQASETRVLTMGDNNMILLDEANIMLFPSRLQEYPNLATAEFQSDDMMMLGMHWKFKPEKSCVLGTYFHNNSAEQHDFAPVNAPLGVNKRFDLFFAKKMNDHKVGFHLGWRHSSDANDKPASQDETGLAVINLDFGLTPKGDNVDLACGLELLTWTHTGTKSTDSSAYDITSPSGNMGLYARARRFKELNDRTTMIPHAELRYGTYEYDVFNTLAPYDLNETVTNDLFRFEAGSGFEYVPANNVLAVLDLGFIYDNVTTTETDASDGDEFETKYSTLVFPYFKVGFDADVFTWMDLRFGSTSYWEWETIDAGGSKDKRGYPDNDTYLGFGFHWNRLHVDVHANQAMFLDGFNFLSGASNNMNFRISAVYDMM